MAIGLLHIPCNSGGSIRTRGNEDNTKKALLGVPGTGEKEVMNEFYRKARRGHFVRIETSSKGAILCDFEAGLGQRDGSRASQTSSAIFSPTGHCCFRNNPEL